MKILDEIVSRQHSGRKSLAVLLDPDKARQFTPDGVDFVFVGGSSLRAGVDVNEYVRALRHDMGTDSNCPIVLFPGSSDQFTPEADGILFLSLISGRNPEYLIGQQVRESLRIRQSGIEVIPTGYILLDGGTFTSTMRVTETNPIPQNDLDTIVRTAVAGELLGMKVLYLEAGSGAINPVSAEVIAAVRAATSLPIIVGGGLRSRKAIEQVWHAGADICVVGNYLEQHPEEMCQFVIE